MVQLLKKLELKKCMSIEIKLKITVFNVVTLRKLTNFRENCMKHHIHTQC